MSDQTQLELHEFRKNILLQFKEAVKFAYNRGYRDGAEKQKKLEEFGIPKRKKPNKVEKPIVAPQPEKKQPVQMKPCPSCGGDLVATRPPDKPTKFTCFSCGECYD